MEVCAIWFQMVSLFHRRSIYHGKIIARWLIKRTMCSPVSRLGFGPSIAPFVGVSSYALEVEHVFLPVGERKEWAWLMFIESLWSRLWRMEAAQLLGRVSIVRLAFAVAQESPERTSERATAWAKLTTFKLSAAQLWNVTLDPAPLQRLSDIEEKVLSWKEVHCNQDTTHVGFKIISRRYSAFSETFPMLCYVRASPWKRICPLG